MSRKPAISASSEQIAEFCRRNFIRRLALFGSVLKPGFRADSDIDVLVEFQAGHVPGLIRLAGMELELSKLFGGRKVDLSTPNSFNPKLRKQILADAEVQFA